MIKDSLELNKCFGECDNCGNVLLKPITETIITCKCGKSHYHNPYCECVKQGQGA